MAKVRYLVEKAGVNGPRWFWQPSAALRAAGWRSHRLLVSTLAEAMVRADELNAELDQGHQRAPRSQPTISSPTPISRRSKAALRSAESRMWKPHAKGCVYVFGTAHGLQKIGLSRQPEQRRWALSFATGHTLKIWLVVAGGLIDAKAVEREAHRLLNKFRREGEWFAVSPAKAVTAVMKAVATVAARFEHTENNNEPIGKPTKSDSELKSDNILDVDLTC